MKKYTFLIVLTLTIFRQDELSANSVQTYLVGVHYYLWYTRASWERIDAEPLLGNYASQEQDVIAQHIRWATDYNIDFFGVGWSGAGKPADQILKRSFLRSPEIHRTKFCIAYDMMTRFAAWGEPPYDFRDPELAKEFIDDFEYLAKTYFGHPRYLKFQGRPVVWIYIARGQKGEWVSVLEKARGAVRRHGYELYLDGDLLWPDKTDEERISYFDAASLYILNQKKLFERYRVSHTGQVADLAAQYYPRWKERVSGIRNKYTGEPVAFHPVITPQFEKPSKPDGLRYRLLSVEDFRRFAEIARENATWNLLAGAKVIWVTSWNEWYEATTIEPTFNGPLLWRNYGFRLLDVIKDVFQETSRSD